jgi:NAD+ kinase
VRFGFIVNLYRPDAIAAAQRAAAWLSERKVEVIGDREGATSVGIAAASVEELSQVDLMLTFGGDGTLIQAAHICSNRGIPVLGIHYGRFGFVTQVLPDQVEEALELFMRGEAMIEKRMMVQTELIRANHVVATLHSLNETVVQRSATTRMLTFEVKVNTNLVSRYPADGVMVATPTGSTAYNLSAGGPVVDPSMDALLITAIMPHTLSARPIVLQPDSVVDVKVETRGEAILSCDGQSRMHLMSGDRVRVTRSPRTTNLVKIDQAEFFRKLSERLNWSQGPKHDE